MLPNERKALRVKGRKLGVSQQHEKISEEREQKYKLESVNKATPGVQSLAGSRLPRSNDCNASRAAAGTTAALQMCLFGPLEFVYIVSDQKTLPGLSVHQFSK